MTPDKLITFSQTILLPTHVSGSGCLQKQMQYSQPDVAVIVTTTFS